MKIGISNCIAAAITAVLLAGGFQPATAAKPSKTPPDLTKGGEKDKFHDWNLGPTGARGWIWGRSLETTGAVQILVTQIDKGSPSDGILKKGDVILGADGRLFREDARMEFGKAITEAEKKENKGVLELIVWRDGKKGKVRIKLPVMGSYSDTAPFNCEKSRKIFENGCEYIADNMKGGIDGRMNALALLASGKEKYVPIVREFVHNMVPADPELKIFGPDAGKGKGMLAWQWGYKNLLMTEYYLATGDEYVLPAIREYSRKIAMGQNRVGTWGHGIAWPKHNDGELHGALGGYGALNQAGLNCFLSLVLAKKCGVEDEHVDYAIDKANEFFGFYIDKGTIPYGHHKPNWKNHDDNGRNSILTVAFSVQADTGANKGVDPNAERGSDFFSRMVVASYGERERGHTGNYWSYLWGGPGAYRAGKHALAEFLKRQRWYYDLARKWDGSFAYQGGAAASGGEHKYGGWDLTGAYLLTYGIPLNETYVTGKKMDLDDPLTGKKLANTIEAGKGFSSRHMAVEPYKSKSVPELFEDLGSWSPAVRTRAAKALASKQDDNLVSKLVDLLENGDLHSQYGACQVLGALGERGADAVPVLSQTLEAEDLWLRILACDAVSNIGKPARKLVPKMLKLAAQPDPEDTHQMMQRYLAFGLFYKGGAMGGPGLIGRSVEGVDRDLLYPAVEQLLENPDGRARSAVGNSLFRKLSLEEMKPILPAVFQAVKEPAPSGVMFASGVRLNGLEALAKNHVAEAMPLCIEIMDIQKWGKRYRIKRCLKSLEKYGGAAKPMIPKLKELQKQLESHRENRKGRLQEQVDMVKDVIEKIKADKNPPELIYVTKNK